MKKLFLVLVFVCTLGNVLFAQDKVITLQGDTIVCKVVRYTKSEVVIEVNNKGITTRGTFRPNEINGIEFSPTTLNSLLSKKNVKQRQLQETEMDESLQAIEDKDISGLPSEKFSFGVQSGYGYLMGSTTSGTANLMSMGFDYNSSKEYYHKLRNTLMTSVDFHYSLLNFRNTYNLSIGLLYQNQYNSGSISGIMGPFDGIRMINGTYSEDIFCNFYAYTVRHTLWLNRKKTSNLYSEGGVGLMTYRNQMVQGYSPFLLQSVQTGYSSSLGFEIRLYKGLCLNTGIGLFVSKNNKFILKDGNTSIELNLDNGQYESFNKLSASAGLTYKF